MAVTEAPSGAKLGKLEALLRDGAAAVVTGAIAGDESIGCAPEEHDVAPSETRALAVIVNAQACSAVVETVIRLHAIHQRRAVVFIGADDTQ